MASVDAGRSKASGIIVFVTVLVTTVCFKTMLKGDNYIGKLDS